MTAENLQSSTTDVKVESGFSLAQAAENSRDPQVRPRWLLVKELRKAAAMTSEDFWLWWFALPKAKRRAMLDVMAGAVDTAPLEDSEALRASVP